MTMNLIKLQLMPLDGVRVYTPEGHYLEQLKNEAQIFTVGDFLSKAEYSSMLPDYSLVSIHTAPAPDNDNVRFTKVLFKREGL